MGLLLASVGCGPVGVIPTSGGNGDTDSTSGDGSTDSGETGSPMPTAGPGPTAPPSGSSSDSGSSSSGAGTSGATDGTTSGVGPTASGSSTGVTSSSTSGGTTSTSGSTTSGSSTSGSTTGTTTGGSSGGGSSGGLGPVTDHGYVRVMLTPTQNEPADLFDDTVEVEVRLQYGSCLEQFYSDHPELRDSGAAGAPIFAAFADPAHPNYLCAQDAPNRSEVDCDVMSIEQRLSDDEIRIRYTVHDDTSVEDALFHFGPIPCEVLTVCEPFVSVAIDQWSVIGVNSVGNLLFYASSFPQRDAVCGQGLPIEIRVRKP